MSSTRTELYTLDTSILIYAMDRTAGVKHVRAADIVDRSVECACVLTLQALAEFVFAVTRKKLVPRRAAVAQARDWLAAFQVVAADTRALEAAYAAVLTDRFGLLDALLLATARSAGCTIALSEGMTDGAGLDGIMVHNPLTGDALPDDLRPLLGMP
jgi:predicted nucleic acid-binding protein